MAYNVFSLGMTMEKEGEEFYRHSAEKVNDPHSKKLLLLLASEEKRHFELIKTYEQELSGVMYTAFLKEVKTVFDEMKKEERNTIIIEEKATIMEILEKALRIEEKSVELYKHEAEKTDNYELKESLLLLKKEEDSHYSLVSSWIEFYGKPALWLEQAEFAHLDEY